MPEVVLFAALTLARVTAVDDAQLHTLGLVRYGEQQLQVEVMTGAHRGETRAATNVVRAQMDIDNFYRTGEYIIVTDPDDAPEGGALIARAPLRWLSMAATFALFAVLLCVFAGGVGFKALLSFVFSCAVVWWGVVPLALKGWNASLVAFAASSVLTAAIMYLVGGRTRKSLVAFAGAMLGVAAALGLAHLLGRVFGVNGATLPYVQTLIYSGYDRLDLADIFVAATVLAASGAMMDLSMDIAAGVCEVDHHHPGLGFTELFRSGMRIGRATVGTMTTTLLLAYSGGYLSLLMVFAAQGTDPLVFICNPLVTAEIVKTFVGSFAIILVAPFTALVAAFIYGKVNHGL